MARKFNFYVVWKGRKPGVYSKWTDVLAQTHGFSEAAFKGFKTREEAEVAYAQGRRQPSFSSGGPKPTGHVLAVDAACAHNPGKMEYRGVWIDTGEVYFEHEHPRGTNNIGEFLAIAEAVARLNQAGTPEIPVYSDSTIAIKWVANKKCKTTLLQDPATAELLDIVRRAEKWLQENAYDTPILKWATKEWGEIPADYGRK